MLAKEFEIRIRGSVPADTLVDFEDLEATALPGETVLVGMLPDQAALYGVLMRIQALGLELVEVRRVDADLPPR